MLLLLFIDTYQTQPLTILEESGTTTVTMT
jgi:hypothetical protein